jgi:F-type H+-transporting ATPase subunit b
MKILGVNATNFIFTIINFLLVFWILKRFLFKPILRVLEERRKKVEEGLAKSAQAENELATAREEARSIIAEANVEAKNIAQGAEEAKEALLRETQYQTEQMIKETHEGLEREKEEIRAEMEGQLIELVSVAVDRVLDAVVGEEEQRILVEKAVSQALVETF